MSFHFNRSAAGVEASTNIFETVVVVVVVVVCVVLTNCSPASSGKSEHSTDDSEVVWVAISDEVDDFRVSVHGGLIGWGDGVVIACLAGEDLQDEGNDVGVSYVSTEIVLVVLLLTPFSAIVTGRRNSSCVALTHSAIGELILESATPLGGLRFDV